MEIVEKTGGVLFALEHRCYSDLDSSNRWHNTDIQYCDSDHAITDMIKFIEYQNLNLPKDIKWVAVGCSYAGRLAVKIRGLYPDLIYATWASSALLYEKPLIPDFFPAVVDNIRKTCGDYLADTANYIIQVAYSGAQSCVYNPEYVKLVSNMIRNAEYKYKIPSYNTSTLETACGAVMHSNNFCGQNVKPKGIMSSTDYYVWKYQECHELGYLQQIQLNGCHQFSIPWTLNELTQSCKQENDLMTEILSKRSRILLVYGIDDPWIIASPPRDYPQIKRIDIPVDLFKMAAVEWPWQYSFPPFFTIQPHNETKIKQISAWRNLVLDYHKNVKQCHLDIREAQRSPLFCNSSINRKLSLEGILMVLDDLARTGNAEPVDKQKHRWYVYWHTLDEWAEMVYCWAQNSGMVNTVCTLFELVGGDNTTNEEFYGLDEEVMVKALQKLEHSKKAELFDNNQGVKFF